MSKAHCTEVRIAVKQGGLFGCDALVISHSDVAEISITCGNDGHGIAITPDEWPEVREAINEMVARIQLAEAAKLRDDE